MGNRTDALLQQGKTVLFAFEEAIGFMCGSTVLDKDGVSAAAVSAEMATYLYNKNMTLKQKLEEIYDVYAFEVNIQNQNVDVNMLIQNLISKMSDKNMNYTKSCYCE